MEKFSDIYLRAVERKGGEEDLYRIISRPLKNDRIRRIDNSEFLSEFTRKVFQSGFVWSVVNKKWAGFEEVFFEFDIEKMLMMPDEMWEAKCKDERIIRNAKKVMTIKDNAQMIYEVATDYGSFGQFVAQWPKDDVIGLWAYLKKHGARLGGNTGPYALRQLGIDTFLLSKDVESYFRAHKLIDGGLTSKRSLSVIQGAFNKWQGESKLSFQEMSQIIAFSTGDNSLV